MRPFLAGILALVTVGFFGLGLVLNSVQRLPEALAEGVVGASLPLFATLAFVISFLALIALVRLIYAWRREEKTQDPLE